jgi:hypothetical protein
MSKQSTILRGNARYVATMQQIRRSSAASPQDPRPNRRRSRGDAQRAAVRDSRGY